ncbi:hypothetical protein EON81_02725, partial [bacterium]
MRYIAFFSGRGFYVRHLLPEEGGAPSVVHREGRVLDADQAAQARGVGLGMPLSEAKMVLGQAGRFLEWSEEAYRSVQTIWLDVCAEHAEIIEPIDQHEAFVDLSGHPDPREALERLREDIFGRTRLTFDAALASSRWIARAAVEHGDPMGKALRDPRGFVAGLPVDALPLATEDVARLVSLGYRRIGELAAVELATLRQQFGSRALELYRSARGGGEANVDPLYPPDSLAGRFHYDGAPTDRETLERGFAVLSEEVGERLQSRDLIGEEIAAVFLHEDGSNTRFERGLARPLSSSESLKRALVRLLPNEIERPVVGIQVRLSNVRRAQRVQLD